MTGPRAHILYATLLMAAQPAWAVDTTLTQAGFTGLSITPSAHLLGWGTMEAVYDNQMPGIRSNPAGHNYVLGFGLLPNLEVVGRIAVADHTCNFFLDRTCRGPRDLSVSAKSGIGLDTAGRFRVAAGVTDFGGAATNFRSYYGVATFNDGPYELSAGLARRSAVASALRQSPLHGPFASAAWQPMAWVRGHVEYTDGNAWAGVRLFAPSRWLPEGWKAHVGVNQRLTGSNLTERNWLSAGLSIPLYKVPALPGSPARAAQAPIAATQQPLPAYEARVPASTQPGARDALPSTPPPPAPPAPPPVVPTDADLQRLGDALRGRGLEDIWVGRMPDGSVIARANNATYNWNSLDALGAALGAIGRTLGAGKTAYRFILTQRQIGMVAVTGQTDCLLQWIERDSPACPAGELSTPGTGPLDSFQEGATWVVSNLKPSNRTLRVSISPVLRTNIATEVGTFDYSAGVNVGFRYPVWPGADVEWRVDHELARSDNFRENAVFGARRIRNGTERLAFTQTVRLPAEVWFAPGDPVRARRWGLGAVFGQATIGRISHHFDGALGTIRWEPGEGLHRLTGQIGYFRNADFGLISGEPRTARPLLAHYRYTVAATRTYLEASAGQFMFNDVGVQFGMRQWFSDLSVGVFYRRTKFDTAASRSFVGLEVAIPIGPRRDMDPGLFQITGTPRFSHGISTIIGNRTNNVVSGYGVMPPAPSLDAAFNADRSGLLYFEDNIRRIRDAAR